MNNNKIKGITYMYVCHLTKNVINYNDTMGCYLNYSFLFYLDNCLTHTHTGLRNDEVGIFD